MTHNDSLLKYSNNDQIYLTIHLSIQDVVASHYLKKSHKEDEKKNSRKGISK